MKIGILQCDSVRSSLKADYGEFPEMFEKALKGVSDDVEVLTFEIYPAHEGQLPDEIDECDAYFITGSRHSVLNTDELWIHQLQNFIVRLNKAEITTIGVCFGHQIMAVAMGGKVERADCGWQLGVHYNEVVHHADFMQPKISGFHVVMFCEDQVVAIDETATVLANSVNCEYAMLQYGNHMLSIQGHPEFSLDFSKALMTKCKEDLPNKRFEQGMTSFCKNELDSELLFTWFLNFLKQNKSSEGVNEDESD